MSNIPEFNRCFHPETRTLFIKNGFPILECKKCSLQFAKANDVQNHITKVYSDEYFFEGKAGYPDYLEEKDMLIASGKRFSKIISKYAKPGNLLDVGCAAGFIMKGYEETGWHCDGVEPNDTMASYGRQEMNLNIFTGSLEEFQTNTKYDLISLIEVIGSFQDIDIALNKISELLKEEGLVIVESWNVKSPIARLLGKKWHEYCPPSVLHWFSDDTLKYLFNNYGFTLIAKGYPAKQINVKHAISILEENFPNVILKKTIFKWASILAGKITLSYPFRDVKWYLFRKSAAMKK